MNIRIILICIACFLVGRFAIPVVERLSARASKKLSGKAMEETAIPQKEKAHPVSEANVSKADSPLESPAAMPTTLKETAAKTPETTPRETKPATPTPETTNPTDEKPHPMVKILEKLDSGN